MDPTIPETERYRKFLSVKYIEFISDKEVQNFYKYKSYDLTILDNSRSILSLNKATNNIKKSFLRSLDIELRRLQKKYENFKNKPIVIADPIEILSDDDDDDVIAVEENKKPYVFIERTKWKMPKKISTQQKPSSRKHHQHLRLIQQQRASLQPTIANVAQRNILPMQQQQIQQAKAAPIQIQQQTALANNQVSQNNQLQQQAPIMQNWPLMQQMNSINMYTQFGMLVTNNMMAQQMIQQQLACNILQQQQISSNFLYQQQQQRLSPNLLPALPITVPPPPIISQNKPPKQNLSQIPVRPSQHGKLRFANNRNNFRPPHRSNNNASFNYASANPRQNDPRINRAYPVDRERDEREKQIALSYREHKRIKQEKERKKKEEEEKQRQINIERAKKLEEINKKHQEEKAVEEKQKRKSRWDDNSAASETIQQQEQTKSKELQQMQQSKPIINSNNASATHKQQQHSEAIQQQQVSKANINSNNAKITHEQQPKQPIKEIPQQTSKATQQQQQSQTTQQREQAFKVIQQQQQSSSSSQKQQSSTFANKPAASSSAQSNSIKENNQYINNESALSEQITDFSTQASEISEISKTANTSSPKSDPIAPSHENSNDAAMKELPAMQIAMQKEEDSSNLEIKQEVKDEIDDRSMSSGATNDSNEEQEIANVEAEPAKLLNNQVESNVEAAVAEVPNIEFHPAEQPNQPEIIKQEMKEEQFEEESYHGSDLASTQASEVPEVANDAENESFYNKFITVKNDDEILTYLKKAMPQLEDLNQQSVSPFEKCRSWIENVGSVSPNYDQPSDDDQATENDIWIGKSEFFMNDNDDEVEIIPYQPSSQISSPHPSQSL